MQSNPTPRGNLLGVAPGEPHEEQNNVGRDAASGRQREDEWNESGDESNAGNWPSAPPPLFDPGRLFQERFAQDDSSTDGSGSKSGDSNWADGETLPPSWIPTENWKRLPTTTFNTTWVYLGTGALTPPDKHSSILSIILDALAGLECG